MDNIMTVVQLGGGLYLAIGCIKGFMYVIGIGNSPNDAMDNAIVKLGKTLGKIVLWWIV